MDGDDDPAILTWPFKPSTFGLGGDDDDGGAGVADIEAVEAEPIQAKRTAEPVKQLSEQAKRTRRRKASLITKDWGEPKLGYAGLLGI